ncbi:IS1595 family transposase [bioreactor metagenome]|uniref:IS1595 family transposase n=1 Tax=bioreactor metagenome TaxID=1076179 RepID=A0A644ZQ18_9ZZZZ
METRQKNIEGIPAILWGPKPGRLFIAVHGDQSCKSDEVIAEFAKEAAGKGYCTLSFDLPEHGDRKGDPRLCSVQNCVEDLTEVMKYARTLSCDISLFGCSMGAYFSMLAYRDESLRQALFLSPVVDMKRIIDNMMMWFNINAEQLRREQEIPTPVRTLYWDYYEYVTEHPVEWSVPTALLYGKKDELCEFEYVEGFAKRTGVKMTVFDEGEHFFHTEEQMAFFRQWLQNSISM